jgi:hypothetical protein
MKADDGGPPRPSMIDRWDAVMAYDAKWIVTQWDAGCEALYGWTASEAVGRLVWEVAPGDGDRAARMRDLIALGVWRGRVTARGKADVLVKVEVEVTAQRDVEGHIASYLAKTRRVEDGGGLDPPRPVPEHLWPKQAALGDDDMRAVPSTGELRAIVKALDVTHIAGWVMLTQRDGSPWLEVDVAVPFHDEARDFVRGECGDPDALAEGGIYKFAVWRYTGAVYPVGPDGAVADDPIPL